MSAVQEEQVIKIKLKAFDYRSLDNAAKEIVDAARRSGANVSGPVPLPTVILKNTVNESPHVNKKAMSQFESRTHSRAITISSPTQQTVEDLRKLNLPAGVEITINLKKK